MGSHFSPQEDHNDSAGNRNNETDVKNKNATRRTYPENRAGEETPQQLNINEEAKKWQKKRERRERQVNTNTKRMGREEGTEQDARSANKGFCFDTLASLFVRTPVNVA